MPLSEHLRSRLLREFCRWQLVQEQIRDLEKRRRRETQGEGKGKGEAETGSALEKVRKLLGLRGLGLGSAWVLVREVFGWRKGSTAANWRPWPG